MGVVVGLAHGKTGMALVFPLTGMAGEDCVMVREDGPPGSLSRAKTRLWWPAYASHDTVRGLTHSEAVTTGGNSPMHVLIVGGGIGGLAAALSLHQMGIGCTVFEQVRELRELGVGINTLPHAIKELAALGLLPALDRTGIRTRELIYANRFGQVVWRELRGTDAGFDAPQFSIHRGKLHGVLLDAVRERLGGDAVRTGCRLVSFEDHGDRVAARFEQREGGDTFVADGDLLVGADGIHSVARAAFYPSEGPPVWNGMMLWRGATDWPVHVDGRTMLIAGGMGRKFVFYPIHYDPATPERRLTNWAVMAQIAT